MPKKYETFEQQHFDPALVVDSQDELYHKAAQNLANSLDQIIFDAVEAQHGKEAATKEQIKLRGKVFQRIGDENKQLFFDGKLLLTWSPFAFRVEERKNNHVLHSEFKHQTHF